MGESRVEYPSVGRQWTITRRESRHERQWQRLVGERERAVGEGEWVSELSEHESGLLWEIWSEIEHESTFCA